MPTNASSQAANSTLAAPVPSTNISPSSAMTGGLLLALLLSLVMIWFGYKKYRAAQRSRSLKRQIALLEAMWRISSTRRKF